MADDRWEPDAKDVERRKNELLAEARGERPGGQNPMLGVGLQFAVTLLVCLFAGQWLDRKFGTTPWLLLAGMLVGSVVGFWSLVRAGRGRE